MMYIHDYMPHCSRSTQGHQRRGGRGGPSRPTLQGKICHLYFIARVHSLLSGATPHYRSMAANSLKATLPSLKSTQMPREPILITENEGENFFLRFARNDQPYAPLSRCLRERQCSDLSATPPLGSFRRPWYWCQWAQGSFHEPIIITACIHT